MKLTILFLAFVAHNNVASFTTPARRATALRPTTAAATTLLASNSKEDEIKKLEEQLRQLKETPEETPQEATAEFLVDDGEPLQEMLSESWKEEETDGGGVLLPIVGSILAVVFLVGFSQVPIGQDSYVQYSAVKSNNKIDLGDLNEARKATEGL